ncbi:MAG TPA: HNH endonuclease [Syntrophomonadaceae bacterium]|nr:HNH endonuclease [Syntrophomonadaceae bacterium]
MNATIVAIRSLKTRHGIQSGVPNARKQYTQEQLDYLEELSAKGLFNTEITKLFNKKFGTSRTENAIQNMRTKYGIKTSARNYWKKGHEPWNKGLKGINIGGKETQFKKGNMPKNYKPVGTEIVDADGYTKVKIADPKQWKMKHVLIWEVAHGPVPEGHTVIFGDGNRQNLKLENLVLVSRAQLVRMNQLGLIKNNVELTKTGIIIADIHNKMGERRKSEG